MPTLLSIVALVVFRISRTVISIMLCDTKFIMTNFTHPSGKTEREKNGESMRGQCVHFVVKFVMK